MNYTLFLNLLAALNVIHFQDKSKTEGFANEQELLKSDNSSMPKPRISSTEANTFTPTTTPKTSFNRTEEIQAENRTSEPMQDINATSGNVTHLTDSHERTQISQSPNATVGQAVSEHEILTLTNLKNATIDYPHANIFSATIMATTESSEDIDNSTADSIPHLLQTDVMLGSTLQQRQKEETNLTSNISTNKYNKVTPTTFSADSVANISYSTFGGSASSVIPAVTEVTNTLKSAADSAKQSNLNIGTILQTSSSGQKTLAENITKYMPSLETENPSSKNQINTSQMQNSELIKTDSSNSTVSGSTAALNTTSSVKLNVTSDPACLAGSSTSGTAPSKTNEWYATSNQSAGSTDGNSSTPSRGESVTNTLTQTTTTLVATSQGLPTILTPATQSETPAGATPPETAKSTASPMSMSASSTTEPSTGGNQTYGSTTTRHTTLTNSASGSITTGVTTQTAGSEDRVATATPTQSGPLTTDIHASTTALTSKPSYTPSYTSEGTTLQSLATASTNVLPTSLTVQATKEEGSSIDQFTQEFTKSAGSVTTTSVTPTQAIQPIAQSTMTQNTSLETFQSTPEGTTDGTPSQRTEATANKNVNSSFTPSPSPVTRVLSANIPAIVTFSSLPSTVVVSQSTAAIDSSSRLPSPLSTEQSSPNTAQANTPGPQFNSTSFPSSRANIIFFKYTPKTATLTPLVFDYPIVNRISFPAPNASSPQEQPHNNTNQAGST